jgi:thiamine-phosphate pyrophosphorylase
VRDLAVLRFAHREDHRPRPRPPRGDRAHEAHARDDGDRGHQDEHTDAPEDSRRRRFRGRQALDLLHGSLRGAPGVGQPRRGGLIPRLNAIVDADAASAAGFPLPALATAFLDGGATFLQLRAKNLPGGALLDAASALTALAHARGALLIVNDRVDIALLSGADGVHLGQDDLDPASARRLLGAAAMIGRSTHTEAQLEAAAKEPVDYIAIGPVFGTATKATGYEAVGLAMVRRASAFGRPVVAIGGITLDTAPAVIRAGAASVAVIGDLLRGDPAARTRAFVKELSCV